MFLVIDTSTRFAGVALYQEGRVVVAHSWHSRQNHTVELMPAVEHLLKQQGATPQALRGIIVALGPGGFSALRVGLSAAKGLALALELPLVGVGTLEAEAYPWASLGLPTCPMQDAGRGEVAVALFQRVHGGWRQRRPERVVSPADLVTSMSRRILRPAQSTALRRTQDTTLFCGEAAPALAPLLTESLGTRAVVISDYSPAGRLWGLAYLGAGRLEAGQRDDLATLQPCYLRRPSITPPKHQPPAEVLPDAPKKP
ncbi:MAG: tRNA (adenosine(37)-N6)-threonylcarbamoyltransferase complex dimerization subunit type 1 TsaB [Dehalococcoidia bacterium]